VRQRALPRLSDPARGANRINDERISHKASPDFQVV